MAEVTAKRLSQLDILKQTGTKGNVLRTAEILHESNPLFQDMQMMEASDHALHRIARQASLGGDPEIRNINEGVGETKSDVTNEEERVIRVQKYATVDAIVYNGKNGKQIRENQNRMIVESIGQYVNRKLLYGGPADGVAHVKGIALRRNAITTPNDKFHNVINNGSTDFTDNTSVYIVQHKMGHFYGVYSPDTKAGIQVQNIPEYTESYMDGSITKKMQVVSTLFDVSFGIVEEDPMSLVRVANVTPYDNGQSGIALLDPKKLIEALNYLRSTDGAVIYVNRAVMTSLTTDAIYKDNVQYTAKDPYGNMLPSFMGVPIRLMDSIINGEAQVA